MGRFFNFSADLWEYFQEVDRKFVLPDVPAVKAAPVEFVSGDFQGIRAVLWDVYGTLCGVSLGDLDTTLQHEDLLERAAGAVIDEFSLGEALERWYPQQQPEVALKNRYLQLIEISRAESRRRSIEYPEVVIENIWAWILHGCVAAGYQMPRDGDLMDMAYRMGYYFDQSLQKTYLYPEAGQCLAALEEAGIIQGIISNAQFYTPIHLRRLLRKELGRQYLELEDIFNEELILFSYELGYNKPNPGAFNRAIEFLLGRGLAAGDIVYVGNDMLNDVWAAKRCGMRTILFAGDSNQIVLRREDPQCQEVRPDSVVLQLRQINELITGGGGKK